MTWGLLPHGRIERGLGILHSQGGYGRVCMMKAATEQKAVNSNNLPGFGASQPQQQAAPAGQAPAQQHPHNKAEAGRLTTGEGRKLSSG